MPVLRILVAVLSLVLSFSASAQKQGRERADSLVRVLAVSGNDTVRASILAELSNIYSGLAPDSGILYGLEAVKLSEQKHWLKGQYLGEYYLGFNYYNKSDYPAALDHLFRSLNVSEAINSETGIANASRKIGNVYRDQKQYVKALAYYYKAQTIFERTGDSLGLGKCYSNIGEIHCLEHRTTEALNFQEKAIDIHSKIGYHNGVVIAIQRLGEVYMLTGDYRQALHHNLQALAVIDKHRPAIAIEQVEESLGALGKNYLFIARADSVGRDSNLRQSVHYLSNALSLAQGMGHQTDLQRFHYYLSEAYAMLGDHSLAYEQLMLSYKLNNAVFSAENNATIDQLERDRERLLNDRIARLEALKAKNERLAIIAGFGALLIIMGLGFRSFRQQRKSNRIISNEKKKSDDLLLNILPGHVAAELKEHGSTKARYFDKVTVLFTDFVNFTGTAERMSTQELVDELDHCFRAFDEIIGKYGIEKIKTIGDAYLAVGGITDLGGDNAKQVLMAAIAIRDFMKQRRQELGDKTFELRAGINSGPVVAGIVGSRKFAYDIWGDTVNTAARMEQCSETGKINISGTTYQLVKDEATFTYRGKIPAKNKGEVDMYFVE